MNAAHLTVRNLPEELAVALEQEKRRRGTSLNQTVIALLEQGLGSKGTRTNGIRRLAGTWTAEEHKQFLADLQPFEEIDQDLWQ